MPLIIAMMAAMAAPAGAQSYPIRPVRWIVPLPAGGGADIVARTVAQRLVDRLGQQIVVENRGGGGTLIGSELAARATPDGHTLFLGTATTHGINSSLVKKLPYDPVRDFAPVTTMAVLPLVLVTQPGVAAANVSELVALARSAPAPLLFASTGNGSSIQLAGELLRIRSGTRMTHVPYKGAAGAVTALLAREVHWMFSTVPPVVEHVKAQRMRAIAMALPRRSSLMPSVPTVGESGIGGIELYSWNGLLVPAGTPRSIVDRLNTEVVRIMRLPEVVDRLASLGAEPAHSTPAEFARFIGDEIAKYASVVKETGAKVD